MTLTRFHEVVANVRTLWRSLAAKLVLLLMIFMAVPIIVYDRFRVADEEKNMLLGRSIQEEGRLIAVGLSPVFLQFHNGSAGALKESLARFAQGRGNVKLLYRPSSEEHSDKFYYIASSPPARADYLNREMFEMAKTGILEKLRDTCDGNRPLFTRYTNPAGSEEILTSITPMNLENGCWAVITSNAKAEFVTSSFARPYWQTGAVRFATAIYALMAVVVIALFVSVWRSLRRFEGLARAIRTDQSSNVSFVANNHVPELAGVAQEFDGLVKALHSSSKAIREAAEENAHALKAPLAVISQSLEPLKRAISPEEPRAKRSLDLIERSVVKLDALVSAARRMDEAAAALIDAPYQKVDLSTLLHDVLAALAEWPRARALTLMQRIEVGISVWGNEDMLETVIENIVENAISVSPGDGTVTVMLRRVGENAELTVEDQGAGVSPDNLERIFERYYSQRPTGPEEEEDHFGIGLWIVRRNVEAMGGVVYAENMKGGGLRVIVRLRTAA